MEQFSLEKYLENPNRKITTRYGDREVRIICTDRKDKRPIVALMIDLNDGSEYITSHSINGWIDDEEKYPDKRDLFFADEELTGFEKELEKFRTHILATSGEKYDKNGECVIKNISKKLLDLARKEIQEEQQEKFGTIEMPIDVTEPYYIKGKQDALKDLPKWKKATEHKDLEKHIAILEENKVLLSNYLEEGDYYIELEDLKTLPKEE